MPNSSPEKLVWRTKRSRPIAGVILAAGVSRRFGKLPKLDARLHGRALLRRACDAAQESSLDAVVAVLGSDADLLQKHCCASGVPMVINPDFADGQSSSLRVGLNVLPKDAVAALFLTADQPFLGTPEIDRIVEVARSTNKVVRAVAQRPDQGPQLLGTPVVFPHRFFPALLRAIGKEGGRQLLRTLRPEEIQEVALPQEALWDVDSLDDLNRLEEYGPR